MASETELSILRIVGTSIDALRLEIKRRHDAGEKFAVPYEPLLDAAKRVVDRGGDARGAFCEVIRGHQYAHSLTGNDLERNWGLFRRGDGSVLEKAALERPATRS